MTFQEFSEISILSKFYNFVNFTINIFWISFRICKDVRARLNTRYIPLKTMVLFTVLKCDIIYTYMVE